MSATIRPRSGAARQRLRRGARGEEARQEKERGAARGSAPRPVPCDQSILDSSKEMEAQGRPCAPSRVVLESGFVGDQNGDLTFSMASTAKKRTRVVCSSNDGTSGKGGPTPTLIQLCVHADEPSCQGNPGLHAQRCQSTVGCWQAGVRQGWPDRGGGRRWDGMTAPPAASNSATRPAQRAGLWNDHLARQMVSRCSASWKGDVQVRVALEASGAVSRSLTGFQLTRTMTEHGLKCGSACHWRRIHR